MPVAFIAPYPENAEEPPFPLPLMAECLLPLYRWRGTGFQNGRETDLGWLEGRWFQEAFAEGVALFEEFEDLDPESGEKQLSDGSWVPAASYPDTESEARGHHPLPRLHRAPLDTHDH